MGGKGLLLIALLKQKISKIIKSIAIYICLFSKKRLILPYLAKHKLINKTKITLCPKNKKYKNLNYLRSEHLHLSSKYTSFTEVLRDQFAFMAIEVWSATFK